MADNEYDSLIESQAPKVGSQPGLNEYDSFLSEDKEQNKAQLQGSMYAAASANPDARAKAISLSNSTGLPIGVVERQFDSVLKKHEQSKTDYDQLIEKNPKLADWLKDPNNSSIAKDDLGALSQIEDQTKEHGLLSSMYQGFKSGGAGLVSSVAKVPAFAYDLLQAPNNILFQNMGRRDLQQRSPEWLRENPVVQKFDELSKRLQPPEVDQSILDQIDSGDYSKAGRTLAIQFATNFPQQAALMASMLSGAGEVGLIGAGLTTAAQANNENQAAGKTSPQTGVLDAAIKGGIEAGFENIGTFGVFKQWESAIANRFGKAISKEVFKDFAKTMAYTAAAEGNEEFLTSIAQDFTDYATGTNPDAMQGALPRAINAGILGSASGIATTAPSGIMSGMARREQARQTALNRDFYTSLGKTAEASKLRERIPEKLREYVDHVTQGTGIENIYVPLEAFQTYFQDQKINPVAAAQEIGIVDKLTEAQATGGPVEIPLSKWVEKVVGTPHYEGLANDVKFHPDSKTQTEIQSETEEAKKLVEKTDQESTAPEQNNSSAKEVGSNIADQLVSAGVDAKTAKTYASIYESTFKTLGERVGTDPKSLFEKYGLKISSVTAEQSNEAAHYETVLNQGKLIDASDRFALKAQPEDVAPKKKTKSDAFYKKLNISDFGRDMLEGFKVRRGETDKSGQAAIKEAQQKAHGPYITDERITGIGWVPNYAAEPTGTIGPARISEPHNAGKWQSGGDKLNISKVDHTRETDPLKWADDKYKATKELIQKHKDAGLPLTINTSSDLIGHNDYIAAMPSDTTVNMYLLTRDPDVNRAIFPGNSSRLRQEKAIQKLRDAGVKVNPIQPTVDSIIEAAGGERQIMIGLGIGESAVRSQIEKALGLRSLNQSDRPFQTEHPYPESVKNLELPTNNMGPKEVRNFFTENIQGKSVTNAMTGWEISFSNKGKKKAANNLASEANRISFMSIDKLMENAILARTEEDRRGRDQNGSEGLRATHVFYAPFSSAGKDFIVSIKVQETNSGEKFYDRFALEKEKPTNTETSQSKTDQPPIGGSRNVNISEFISDVKTLQAGDPFFHGGSDSPRGRIRFGNGKFNIDLLENADRSTFLHETGHLFLEVLGDLANSENAPQQVKDDFTTVLNWLGVESRDQITREHHEQWARGFEAYLMDGKAPSSKLRQAFAKFRTWLTYIYRNLTALNVNLSDEVKGVMDRLVATEDEIRETNDKFLPLFIDAKSAGMSDAQAEKYIQARQEAQFYAEDQLNKRLIGDLRRQDESFYKEKEKGLRSQAESELSGSRKYQGLSALKEGTLPDGSPLPNEISNFKITKSSLIEAYGKEGLKELSLPKGITSDDGVHLELIAPMLGYENGSALIKDLSGIKPAKEVATEIAKSQMSELYPDSLTDGSISDEGLRAIHNEKRSDLLRMELQHLVAHNFPTFKNVAQRMIRRVPPESAVRDQAHRILGLKSISEIKPHLYLGAERKASVEAAKAFTNGDIDAAFEAKRKELLNHELYKAAIEAKDLVKKAVKDFRKVFKSDADIAKTRDLDIVNAARAVLSEFGILKSDKTAEQYLAPMKEYDPEGYETTVALVNSATEAAGPYNKVSFDDFVTMKDSVDALWDLAKSNRELLIDGAKLDRIQIQEELKGKISELITEGKEGYRKTASKWDRTKMNLLGFRAGLTRIEHWADAMDVKPNGPFRKYIWQPVSDATTQYRLEKAKALTTYQELLKEYRHIFSKEKILAPELRMEFKDKTELMMAVLHSGNDSNLRKLLLGYGWGSQNEDGSLNQGAWDSFIDRAQKEGILTKDDFDFAQKIWDLNDSLKPGAQKAHKQMYGYYFNEVTADSFETRFGRYKGGYIPAKVDSYTVEDGRIRQEREDFEKNNGSWQFPTSGRGFTKSRVENYTQPLSLHMNLLGSHIDGVLRFTHIEPTIKQTARIVMDKGFRSTLFELDPIVASDALVPWLQRSATQKVVIPSKDGIGRVVDVAAKYLRSSVAAQIMFGNVTNTIQQFTGVIVAATKVNPRNLRNGLFNYVTGAKSVSETMLEKSDFMRSTQGSNIHETQNAINEILVNPSTFDNIKNFTNKHKYFLQSAAQNIVNTIVWTGSYEQAIEEGKTENEAVRAGDSAVRLTQGSNNPEDISHYETGTPSALLFKQFIGYFNMLANLNAGELIKISRDVGLKKGAGRAFYAYTMGIMIPAVISEAIAIAMAGQKFDQDDDDSYLDDALSVFFGAQAKTLLAPIPYAGQIGVAAWNNFNDKRYDDRLSLSPVLSTLETAVAVPSEVYKAMTDGLDSKKKVTRDVLNLLGFISSLPIGPVGKPAGYLIDVNEGNAQPTGPVDFARGLVTGRPGEQ